MDATQFEALYRAHYAEILRYAARRTDIETAREVTAETFIVAWRRRADVPTDGTRAWLYAVARRTLANERRSGERRERVVDRVRATTGSADLIVDDLAQQRAERAEIQGLLARLNPAAREALELTEWDDLSPAEAARVVGCSTGAFRVRLHRARRELLALYRWQPAADVPEQVDAAQIDHNVRSPK